MFNRVAKGDIGVAERTEARVVAGDSGVCMRKKNMEKAKLVVQRLPKGHEAARQTDEASSAYHWCWVAD